MVHTEISSEKQCAPCRKYEDGSCLSLELLEAMIDIYNKENPTNTIDFKKYAKIEILNPSKYKKWLVHSLKHALHSVCTSQACWTTLEMFQKLHEDKLNELLNRTFKPIGPANSHEWLSNEHIDKSLSQFENIFCYGEYFCCKNAIITIQSIQKGGNYK